ncbi:hypothetical protein [Streptomyces collinus]|uniref:hypothetical protein n=1 Tax=Streptomyces collinus TaxID=42684 RepID=UPI0036A7F58C
MTPELILIISAGTSKAGRPQHGAVRATTSAPRGVAGGDQGREQVSTVGAVGTALGDDLAAGERPE